MGKLITFLANNQAVLIEGNEQTFQSYNSIIAKKTNDNKIILDINKWDYSRTTLKYLCQFLQIQGGKKTILKMLNDGEIILLNLN